MEFGECIDLINFTVENCKKTIYELILISSNLKNADNNDEHYITFCKNEFNTWFKFDDSIVESSWEDINANYPNILIYKNKSLNIKSFETFFHKSKIAK